MPRAKAGEVIGYARVSTDKQDAERQRLDIQKYCEAQGLALARVEEETISSRKTERKIYELVASLKKGDVLVVTEMSRLARSMIELNGIVSDILRKGAELRVCDGQKVDASKESILMVTVLGYAAQTEREMISERTKSALRARKASGVKLGRPEGLGVKVEQIAEDKGIPLPQLERMVESGASAASIARMLGLDARTVQRWKASRGEV